jgi:hypothetical protein
MQPNTCGMVLMSPQYFAGSRLLLRSVTIKRNPLEALSAIRSIEIGIATRIVKMKTATANVSAVKIVRRNWRLRLRIPISTSLSVIILL